jgi:hypothetical protein
MSGELRIVAVERDDSLERSAVYREARLCNSSSSHASTKDILLCWLELASNSVNVFEIAVERRALGKRYSQKERSETLTIQLSQ